MMVLTIIAAVVGALAPSVRRQLMHARVNRAASVVAGDFFLAQSIAGRQRVPVSIAFDDTAKSTVITDSRSSTTVLVTRRFGPGSDFNLVTFAAAPASVLVLPNGMATTTVTVTLGDGSYQRQVRLSRAGQVRIL